jgi:hypothetical protein
LIFGPPAAVDTRSIILRTSDGGATWIRQRLAWTKKFFYAVCFADPVTATAVGDSGMIIRTTDGGKQWVAQNGIWDSENYIQPITLVRFLGVSFSDLNRGIAVGDSGVILGTSDGGATWAFQPSGTTRRLNGVQMLDSLNAITVGDSATILRTTDGGASWSAQTFRTLNRFYGLSFTGADMATIVGGGGTILGTIAGGIPVSVGGNAESSVPLGFGLSQNYPNPFNSTTAISFQLSAVSVVRLEVFDLLGRKVATLADEVRPAGRYTVRWDAASVASGVYFYRLRGGSLVQTKKALLLR